MQCNAVLAHITGRVCAESVCTNVCVNHINNQAKDSKNNAHKKTKEPGMWKVKVTWKPVDIPPFSHVSSRR